MPNRIGLAIHYLACFKAGLVATPLNYRYTFREIDHALEVSGAAALLAHEERGRTWPRAGWSASCRSGAIAYGDRPRRRRRGRLGRAPLRASCSRPSRPPA